MPFIRSQVELERIRLLIKQSFYFSTTSNQPKEMFWKRQSVTKKQEIGHKTGQYLCCTRHESKTKPYLFTKFVRLQWNQKYVVMFFYTSKAALIIFEMDKKTNDKKAKR